MQQDSTPTTSRTPGSPSTAMLQSLYGNPTPPAPSRFTYDGGNLKSLVDALAATGAETPDLKPMSISRGVHFRLTVCDAPSTAVSCTLAIINDGGVIAGRDVTAFFTPTPTTWRGPLGTYHWVLLPTHASSTILAHLTGVKKYDSRSCHRLRFAFSDITGTDVASFEWNGSIKVLGGSQSFASRAQYMHDGRHKELRLSALSLIPVHTKKRKRVADPHSGQLGQEPAGKKAKESEARDPAIETVSPDALHIALRIYAVSDKRPIPWGGAVQPDERLVVVACNTTTEAIRLVLQYTDSADLPCVQTPQTRDLEAGAKTCFTAFNAPTSGSSFSVCALVSHLPLAEGSPMFFSQLPVNIRSS